MKRAVFLSACLLCAAFGQAQDLGFGKSIPAGAAPSSALPASAMPKESALDWKPAEKKAAFPEAAPKSLFPKQDFVDPAEKYTRQMNDKMLVEKTDISFVGNGGSLGRITTESAYVTVRYRDFGDIDGDKIRIFLNGRTISHDAFLTVEFASIRVELEKGTNVVSFQAISVGNIAPNTAQVSVVDKEGNVIGNGGWDLDAGASASFTIVRR